MSTYRKIHGRSIQAVTTDPTESVAEGQVWYNTTSDTFKSVISSSAWVSSVPLPETASNGGGAGIQTAALFFGGRSGGAQRSTTSEYNGLGYSAGGAMGTARNQMGTAGTQTAALAATGIIEGPSAIPAQSEEYNGTAWTAGGSASTARFLCGGAGIQTAAVITGGRTPSYTNATEEYDGSSWTSGGVLNRTATLGGTTTGSLTAAVAFGGSPPSPADATNDVTFYDGTSWSEVNNTPIGIKNGGSGGPQTSALYFGGTNPPGNTNVATTVLFDGTNFSTSGNMGSSIYIQAPAANATNNKTALSMGGYVGGGSYTAATEEFTTSANVITAAAFSSGGNLNTARWSLGGAGTKSAAIVFGGRNPPVGQDLALSEEYNGTSWSEGPDLNTATRVCGRGTGTSTAALKHGGHAGSPSTSNKTAEEWNGSSWSNGGASTNNHDGTMQIGTQTAAASCGSGPPTGAKTEEYNGTSWTASNDMPYSAYMGSASGSQTAGVVFGGGYPAKNNSAEYDGTNWTAGNTLIQTTVGQGSNGGSGTQTLAIGAGGYTPGPTYLTAAFTYDGTNFATAPSMSAARQEVAAQGANTSFYVAGGLTAPAAASNATEEFTGETTALNVKTLTQS